MSTRCDAEGCDSFLDSDSTHDLCERHHRALRDRFAIASIGLAHERASGYTTPVGAGFGQPGGRVWPPLELVAECAYELADAMLSGRHK